MKQVKLVVVANAFLVLGFFAACNSSGDKVEAAETKVENAKEDLKEAERLADTANSKAAQNAAWKIFKIESEAKIKANEVRIAALKTAINKPGKSMDAVYGKRIQLLEEKNNSLKQQMELYEKDQSNWEAFKKEFNNDMDELGRSLSNFTINSK